MNLILLGQISEGNIIIKIFFLFLCDIAAFSFCCGIFKKFEFNGS